MRILLRILVLLKNTGMACPDLHLSSGFNRRYHDCAYLHRDAVNNALQYNATTLKVTGDMKLLVFYGIAIIILSLLRGLFSFGQSYFAEYAGQKVAYDLRNGLYDRIQRLSFAFTINPKRDS